MIGIFGSITPPKAIQKFETAAGPNSSGIFVFLSALFRLAGTVAGIFFIIQIMIAGFSYLSASGDEKKTAQAFATIWQSMIGLAIVASAFVIASVLGNWIGISILNPTIN
jgi:hypothetical protein